MDKHVDVDVDAQGDQAMDADTDTDINIDKDRDMLIYEVTETRGWVDGGGKIDLNVDGLDVENRVVSAESIANGCICSSSGAPLPVNDSEPYASSAMVAQSSLHPALEEDSNDEVRSKESHNNMLDVWTDWDRFRDFKDFRGGSGKTVWYRTRGRYAMCYPPSSLRAAVDELYVHLDERTSRSKYWVVNQAGLWVPVHVGDRQPSDPERRLSISRTGDPSWVTKETSKVYRSRHRKDPRGPYASLVRFLDLQEVQDPPQHRVPQRLLRG